MDTEFPRRIPTVRNNTDAAVVNYSSTKSEEYLSKTEKFQQEILKIITDAIKTFEKLLTESINTDKNTAAKKKRSGDSSSNTGTNAVDSGTGVLAVFNKAVLSLDKVVDIVQNGKFGEFNSWLSKKLDRGFSSIHESWTDGLKNLQRTVESTSDTIGGAIGSIFGSGLFGRTISSIITKALTFAVNKVLIGLVLSNLPMTLLVGGIVAGIAALIYYSKEIWEGIKWLGWSIDQGLDAIASIWKDSKYENARKELGKQTGLSESDILEYYGDTVRGRNQAYEDYKKSLTDENFKKDLIEQIKSGHAEALAKIPTYSNLQLSGEKSSITEYYNNTTINNNNNDSLTSSSGQLALDSLPDVSTMMPINNVTTVNNTAVGRFTNNISDKFPSGSLSLGGGLPQTTFSLF